MGDGQDERLKRLEYAVWGLRGDNGLVSDVRAIRASIEANEKAEQMRRDEETKSQRARDRTALLSAITAIISLLGIIVTLVLVLQSVG